jgi:hypothetical protein
VKRLEELERSQAVEAVNGEDLSGTRWRPVSDLQAMIEGHRWPPVNLLEP